MTTATPLLLSWSHVESLDDIERLRRVLDALPDDALIAALEKRRGKGRNDYPCCLADCLTTDSSDYLARLGP